MAEETKMETAEQLQVATVSELEDILYDGETRCKARATGDEVYNGILVGDIRFAKNIRGLQKSGVTHVLNCTVQNGKHGKPQKGVDFYAEHDIAYMGIAAADHEKYRLDRHFEETGAFIDRALKGGGKVLVHCALGYSRSTAIVIAYLMTHHGLSVVDATRRLRERRLIGPNPGFLRQLCELEERLYVARTTERY